MINFKIRATNTIPELINMGYYCAESTQKKITDFTNKDIVSCFGLCSANVNCKAFGLVLDGADKDKCNLYKADDCTYD